MPNTSVVFSPELDERQLNKETKKINQELNQSAQDIQADFDGSGMDSLRPAGAGAMGGRGGGMGAGGAMGAGALASKIPKPIAGVSVASAMPVALGGAIGAGMLSAMHGASARLQTSTSLLGQAWNNIWRPMGNKVDQLFIRPVAMDILKTTQEWGELFRSSSWLVDPLLKGMASVFTFDAVGMGSAFKELMANTAEKFGWPELPAFDWPSLPSFSWPEIPSPEMPDWTGLTLNFPDWLDRWVENETSTSTSTPTSSITTNRPGDPLSGTRGRGEVVSGPNQNASGGGGGGQQTNTPGSGGNARMPEVETRLDETNKNLRDLKDAMHNMGIEMNGEKVGRMTEDAQRNRVLDTETGVI